MWYTAYEEELSPSKGYYHDRLKRSGLKVFKGKNINDMTEEDAKEARQYIWENTGTLYI